MAPKSLVAMSTDELAAKRDALIAENEALMSARGKAEREFKAQQSAVQTELNRVAAAMRVASMSDAERAELRAALEG